MKYTVAYSQNNKFRKMYASFFIILFEKKRFVISFNFLVAVNTDLILFVINNKEETAISKTIKYMSKSMGIQLI